MAAVATDTTDLTKNLPETPTIHQAFEAAKAQHSTQASTDPADDDEEHALAPGDSSDTDEDKGAPADKGTADLPAKGKVTTAATDETGLISDAEMSALQTKHANDPAKLLKEYNRVFTQKSQALSADRKTFDADRATYDRVKDYVPMIEAFEEDAPDAIARLAEQYGLRVVKADGTETETTERPNKEGTTAVTTAKATAALIAQFREDLGPELDYLADPLEKAVKGLVQGLTKSTVEEVTAPLKQQADSLRDKQAVAETGQIVKGFEARHPDWQEHEEAIVGLMKTLQPNGLSEDEYLDRLYQLATREKWEKNRDADVADRVEKALKQVEKGAQTTERRRDAIPADQVQRSFDGNPTVREAFDLAKQGIRLEH